MAITNKFPVAMGDVFPHGAFVVSEVEPVRDFDKSTPGRPVQQLDKESGLPVWSVSVLDADPAARRTDKRSRGLVGDHGRRAGRAFQRCVVQACRIKLRSVTIVSARSKNASTTISRRS